MAVCFSTVRRSVVFQKRIHSLALGYIFVAIGCTGGATAPKTVPVKGTVMFRDKPLAKVNVTFYAKGSSLAPSAITNEQGQFELGAIGKGAGAVPGPNVVTVSTADAAAAGSVAIDPSAVLKGGGAPLVKSDIPAGGNVPPSGAASLPTIYSNAISSPLKVTISDKGESDLKLELK